MSLSVVFFFPSPLFPFAGRGIHSRRLGAIHSENATDFIFFFLLCKDKIISLFKNEFIYCACGSYYTVQININAAGIDKLQLNEQSCSVIANMKRSFHLLNRVLCSLRGVEHSSKEHAFRRQAISLGFRGGRCRFSPRFFRSLPVMRSSSLP